MTSAVPTVSVITPVHNGGDEFRQCLVHLTTATPPPDELIVIADGDTDGSWRVAQAFGATVVRLPEAGGPARARNLGAQKAHGDILFFIDADVAIAPDAIAQVKTVFAEDPDLAALFGSYDDAPAQPNFLSQYKNLIHHYIHQIGNEDASTFWSGCGAIRRDVFLKMGGFDTGYPFPCIEDIELGYRLKQNGYRIRLHKALQGKHLKHWGVVSLVKTDVLRRALPWTELILRDRLIANDLNLDSSNRVSVMSTFLLLAFAPTTLLAALTGIGGWPLLTLGTAGLITITLLLAVNAHVYRFFWRKRGLKFTLQAIPWHWFYFLYGGLAFIAGVILHRLRNWGITRITFLPADSADALPSLESKI